MAQKVVNTKLAFGIEGEFYDSSVKRAVNRKLAADAQFGKVVFLDANGNATPTYNASTAAKVAGIMVNPKEYINKSADLAASLTAKAGTYVGIADLGRVIVKVANAAKIGDKAFTCVTAGTAVASETTNYKVGDICAGTAAPASSAAAGGVFVEITGAMFDIVNASANELAVLSMK